jgi:peptidoglycan/LPS O-acetylase OafA/YrhL
MTRAGESLLPLTSLRFVAAFAVLLFHIGGCLLGDADAQAAWDRVFWIGIPGVTFFYMLSGFILAYNYYDQFRALSRRAIWNFYVARWARIYPVYFLTFLLVVPVSFPGQTLLSGSFGTAGWKALANLSLVQCFSPSGNWNTAFNPVAWSLSVEWFFYLCFPFLLWGWLNGGPLRRVLVVGLAAAPWALATGYRWAHGGWTPEGHWLSVLFPPARLLEFTVGCVLGWLGVRYRWIAAGMYGRWRDTVLEVTAVAAVGLAVYFAPLRDPLAPLLLSVNGYFLPVFAAAIVIFARGRGWLSALLSRRVPVYLGESSYALYMIHYPIIMWVMTRGHAVGVTHWAVWQKQLLIVVASLSLSAVCFRYYEVPLRSWLRRRLSVSAAPIPAGAAAELAPLRMAA